MIPLLACSLVSLALTLERLIFWGRIKSQQAVQDMLRLVEAGPVKKKLPPDLQNPLNRFH
jgi:hypothetical protein